MSTTMDSFSGEGCRAPRPDTGHGGGSTYGRTLIEFETFHKRDHKLSEGKKYIKFIENVFFRGYIVTPFPARGLSSFRPWGPFLEAPGNYRAR